MKNKRTTNGLMGGVFTAVLLFLLYYLVQQIREPAPVALLTPKAPAAPGMVLPEDLPLFDRLKAEARQLEFKRDPFIRAPLPDPPQEPVLMGIAWEDANPTVIIDNMILRKGESFNGKTLVEIFPDSVIINDGIKDKRLFLGGD